MSGGIIEPSLNPDKDPADANWERQTTDVVNELQHSVNNLVIEPQEKIALIYADTDNIATNIQNYTPVFASGKDTGLFVSFYSYTGTLPTLPIREGITFTPYSPNPVDVTLYQYRRSATRPSNAGNVTYTTNTGAWTSTGGAQPWQKDIPAQDNVPTWVCFAIIEKSDGVGAITKTWSNPVLLYARERSSGIVWHTVRLPSGSPPSLPSATDYNFTTGAFTGLTTNWQQTPPEIKIGEGNNTINDLYWQCNFLAELHPGASTATVTFYSPQSYVPFGTNIQSDNYNGNIGVTPGTQGWAIKRDTGFAEFGSAAIRDTLTIGKGGTGSTTSSGALSALGGLATGGAAADVNNNNTNVNLNRLPSGAVNSNISIGANGVLSGAGGGTVTASALGALIASDLGPSGTTTIDGGRLTTGQINANNCNVINLNAASITAGNLSADRIQGGTISGVSLNISGLTSLLGTISAPNLNVGVILQVVSGSGGAATFGSGNYDLTGTTFTTTNDSTFNTDLVFLMLANAGAFGSGQTGAAGARLFINGSVAESVSTGSVSHGQAGKVAMLGKKIQVAKGVQVKLNLSYAINQNEGGGASMSGFVFEVRRV